LAVSALTGIGFRLTDRTAGSMEMVGPGMNSSRESALVGASRIRLVGGGGELALDADLGGVARLSRFVMLFPISLALCMGVLFALVFSIQFGLGLWILAVAAAVGGYAALWFVLGPMMARSFRTRTCRGLDALLANMVAVGEAA
jgi:hypothetical protein